jgi:hypothetical protein
MLFLVCVYSQQIRMTTNFYNHLSKAIKRNIIDDMVWILAETSRYNFYTTLNFN